MTGYDRAIEVDRRPAGDLFATRFFLWCVLTAFTAPLSAAQAVPADLVFIGKHIITMVGDEAVPAQNSMALAVSGDRIVWLGPSSEVASRIGPLTRVVRLGRRALLPGFIDAHGHLTLQARTINFANVASPPVGPVNDMRSLISTLQGFAAARKFATGDWIIGNGYDDSLLAEGRHPTRNDLDLVKTEHPLVLLHVSGHLMAANSRALAMASLTADTPDPDGGKIRRFAGSDEPNGVLEETATYPLRPYMVGGAIDPMAALRQALALYASYGITTVQDGATSAEGIALIAAAAAAGHLTQDVHYYPVVQDLIEIPDSWHLGEYRNRARASGIKLVLDGSPQGKTAFLSEPYRVPPDGEKSGYRGYPIYPAEQVTAMVGHYLQAGVPILAHANGDAAADMLIAAVSAAAPRQDHRTVMIHAQTVREDQLDDMSRLGMIPSFFSAHTFYWGDWHRDSVLGAARALRISPTRSAMGRDMVFTVHNDAPIVPPDMVRLLWATTNRETRSGQLLGAEQRLDTYTALLAMTRFAAYQAFEEDLKGSLEVGKRADLVLLSRNPLVVRPRRLKDLKVLGTWSHGRQIFGDAPK